MPKPVHSAKTVGGRLALAYSLHPGAYRATRDRLSLRSLDVLCDPPLGKGHAAQIIAGLIKDPGASTIARLAVVLGCSFEWLGAREGSGPCAADVEAAVAAARERMAKRKAKAERAAAAGEGVAK